MTTFDDREQAFEKKFALDQDLKFRAEAKRNKLLAEWAAAKLGIMGAALEDYVQGGAAGGPGGKGRRRRFPQDSQGLRRRAASPFPMPRSGP